MTWWRERPWSDEHAHPEFDGEMPPGPGFRAVVEPDPLDGGFIATIGPAMSQGETPEAAEMNAREALSEILADAPLAPWGGPAPQPKLASRRGLARALTLRAAIVVLAIVLWLLLGCIGVIG